METGNFPETFVVVYETACAQIFQKSGIRLKIIGPVGLTWSKLRIDDPQILGDTVKNSFAGTTWSSGFVNPYIKLHGVTYKKMAVRTSNMKCLLLRTYRCNHC